MPYATDSANFALASTQYASIADNVQTGLDLVGDCCFELWVKFTSIPGSGQELGFINKYGNGSDAQRAYRFFLENVGGTQHIRYSSRNASTEVQADWVAGTDYTALTTGVWYHLAFTHTGTTGTFFINGISKGNKTVNADQQNTVSIVLIANNTVDTVLDGRISLFRVWNTSRSQGDLITNWCTALGTTTDLSAEWVFDGEWTDNSGNGNTLTPVNTPTFVTDIPAICTTDVSTSSFFLVM